MEETIFIIIIIIFFIALLKSSDVTKDNYSFRDEFKDENKEEQFYHPTTGYKGTKEEMNTYIINREKNKNT